MKFKICQDINKCRELWSKFSPKEKLFDIWDYRMCFYDVNDNVPYFIIGYDKDGAIGIIPLCYVKSKSNYTYFGGWFPERNSFFLKDKTKMAEFLEQCPKNTFIEGIEPSERRYHHFLEDEYTYYLNLSKYNHSFENYFSDFDKKKQKNIKRDVRNINEYEIYRNRIQDFDRLVELNIKQHEEDSKLNNKTVRDGIYKMIKVANKNGLLDMVSVEINGRVEAVDIGVIFGEWYYALIGGANSKKIPNIGKLMTILSIKNAIEKKANFIDFAATSGYWKSMWNFDKEMLLKFMK